MFFLPWHRTVRSISLQDSPCPRYALRIFDPADSSAGLLSLLNWLTGVDSGLPRAYGPSLLVATATGPRSPRVAPGGPRAAPKCRRWGATCRCGRRPRPRLRRRGNRARRPRCAFRGRGSLDLVGLPSGAGGRVRLSTAYAARAGRGGGSPHVRLRCCIERPAVPSAPALRDFGGPRRRGPRCGCIAGKLARRRAGSRRHLLAILGAAGVRAPLPSSPPIFLAGPA